MITEFCRLNDAIERVSKVINIQLNIERVSLLNAIGRVAAKDVTSPCDIPPYDRSVVDGYAVRAEDTYGASPSNPLPLRIVGEANFDTAFRYSIGPGEAVRIHTGVPLPKGANAVIMLEDVVEDKSTIYVMKSVGVYANVSRRGEDMPKGFTILKRGQTIEPWHVAALAAVGLDEVEVFERLRLCLLTVGDEIVEPSKNLDPVEVLSKGKVFSSTHYLLLCEAKRLGFLEPVHIGIVGDSPHQISNHIRQAIEECHSVITTGGTGPGQRDVVVKAVKEVGSEVVVRGIAMRPGRTTSVAVLKGKPIFMLSGFPVAAYIAFRFFVIPSLTKALGITESRNYVYAKLTRRVVNRAGYTTFVRVKLFNCGTEVCAEPLASTGSGLISTLLESNGILKLPDDIEGYEAGELVPIELL
ncbi:MAG TPA: molybdopterin molybdenumtransferase MoeA [Ignisphaera aggregans]|uniref:Molybdopterin molybdenumtransferase MoeA n=1 Tax=Ignisphaera aggregans TaxID=334771 RepID=A0A832YY18_9CREN|nr:molybdopterin molybdenumtransferase MoeA [Ignisphaera aggregans]